MKTWDNTIRSGMSVAYPTIRCDGCRVRLDIDPEDANEVDYCSDCQKLRCVQCGVFCGPMFPGFTPPAVNYCGECADAQEALFVDADGYAVSRI